MAEEEDGIFAGEDPTSTPLGDQTAHGQRQPGGLEEEEAARAFVRPSWTASSFRSSGKLVSWRKRNSSSNLSFRQGSFRQGPGSDTGGLRTAGSFSNKLQHASFNKILPGAGLLKRSKPPPGSFRVGGLKSGSATDVTASDSPPTAPTDQPRRQRRVSLSVSEGEELPERVPDIVPQEELSRLGTGSGQHPHHFHHPHHPFRNHHQNQNQNHHHHDQHPHHAVEELERGAQLLEELRSASKARRPWFLKTQTWVVMFAVVFTLCLISTVLSTRRFSHLIELAPVVKEAGQRLMLVKAGVFFARELVLADHFSRMSQQELSDGLLFVVEEMKRADRALRLGDAARGVKEGADGRNQHHNKAMYTDYCPWTTRAWQEQHGKSPERYMPQRAPAAGAASAGSSAEGGSCADPARPSVGAGGLLSVLVTFENALLNVLARHGLPADAEQGRKLLTYDPHPLEAFEQQGHADKVWEVWLRRDFDAHLEADEDLVYVLQSFDGYLADGMQFVIELVDAELDEILEEAIELNEALFALYLIVTVLAFWHFLFRKVAAHAHGEALMARMLVRKIPLHVLTQPEIDSFAEFFHDDDDDDDAAAE